MSALFPWYYYYPLMVADVGAAGVFSVLGLMNPMQGYADQLPMGYDVLGDKLVGSYSPRVALSTLIGGVMGPVWAITTAFLLPFARNGMKDRPDYAEKVIRAHLISGAIIDPIHGLIYMSLLPPSIRFDPSKWNFMIGFGLSWLTILTTLKIGWCAGIGRASAKDLMAKKK